MDTYEKPIIDIPLTSTSLEPPVKRKRGRPPKPKVAPSAAPSFTTLAPRSEVHPLVQNKENTLTMPAKDNFALNLTESFFSSLSDLSSLQMPTTASSADRLNEDLRTVPLPSPSYLSSSSVHQPTLPGVNNPQTPQKLVKRNPVVFPLSSPPCIPDHRQYDSSMIKDSLAGLADTNDNTETGVIHDSNLICTPNALAPSMFINTPITSTHEYYKRTLTSSPNVPRDHVDPSLILQKSNLDGDYPFSANSIDQLNGSGHKSSSSTYSPSSHRDSMMFNPTSPITPRTFSNIIHSSPLYHGYYSSPSQPSKFSLKPIPIPPLQRVVHADNEFDDMLSTVHHHSYDDGFFAQPNNNAASQVVNSNAINPNVTCASKVNVMNQSPGRGKKNLAKKAQYPYKLRPTATFSVSDGLLLEEKLNDGDKHKSQLPLRSLSVSPSPLPCKNLKSSSSLSLSSSLLPYNIPESTNQFTRLRKRTKWSPITDTGAASWCEKKEIRFAVSPDGQAIIEQVKILKRRVSSKYSHQSQFNDCYDGDNDDDDDDYYDYDDGNNYSTSNIIHPNNGYFKSKSWKKSKSNHAFLKRRKTGRTKPRYRSNQNNNNNNDHNNKARLVKFPREPVTPTAPRTVISKNFLDNPTIDANNNKRALNMDQCDNYGALLTPISLSSGYAGHGPGRRQKQVDKQIILPKP